MCGPERCSTWISLSSIGIHAEGCLKNPLWFPKLVSSQTGYNYINLHNKRLLLTDIIAHGKFGNIDLAVYETDTLTKEVYVKRPILSENLFMEACIQKLVGDSLRVAGFPLGSPRVVSIFALQNGSVCFAMDTIKDAITLNQFLDIASVVDMPSIIIDCLLQLCAMLSHIHHHLGINHRDLKPSNFLITEHEPVLKHLLIDGKRLDIHSRYSLTIIDFGFACIGTVEPPKTHVSLSTVYSAKDRCPKEGRDLFLFLGLLYLDYHQKLPPTLLMLFESWTDASICAFMRKNKQYSMEWLYFMAGNERVQRFPCSPARVVRDLLDM